LGYSISKKGLDLFIDVKEKIESKIIEIPYWIYELADKLKNLSEISAKSVLKNNNY
jgi:hypothetical protein